MVLFETFYFSIAAFHRSTWRRGRQARRRCMVVVCRRSGGAEKWESTRGDRGSASFPKSERMKTVGIV